MWEDPAASRHDHEPQFIVSQKGLGLVGGSMISPNGSFFWPVGLLSHVQCMQQEIIARVCLCVCASVRSFISHCWSSGPPLINHTLIEDPITLSPHIH